MRRRLFSTLLTIASVIALASCSKDAGDQFNDIYNATVTFKPQSDGTYFLKQDDSTALIVLNKSLAKYPFAGGKEKRALVQYKLEKNPEAMPVVSGADAFKYKNYVTIYSVDTIYTKKPLLFDPAKKYGEDPIGLYLGDDVFPTTLIEDGYLNVTFNIPVWYDSKHEINLVYGVNPEDPYEVEIRHRAENGNINGKPQAFIMNFPLKDLPDTQGKTVKLTLKWNSITQGKVVSQTFDYRSRTDW